MARAREACRKYGTLFVADEVATGFGRTGRLFASEHFGLGPDVMCLAKAITAGYAPMGATVATEAVAAAAGWFCDRGLEGCRRQPRSGRSERGAVESPVPQGIALTFPSSPASLRCRTPVFGRRRPPPPSP